MSDSPRKKLRVQFSASSLVATRYFSSQDSPVIVRPPQKLPNEAVCSLSTARQKNWNEKSPIDFAVPSPNESCGSKANSPTSQFNFQTETDSKRCQLQNRQLYLDNWAAPLVKDLSCNHGMVFTVFSFFINYTQNVISKTILIQHCLRFSTENVFWFFFCNGQVGAEHLLCSQNNDALQKYTLYINFGQ